ncbi:hypothetical protein HUJ04_000178 [Dendroctonus ponderosae]|nr:hypothetical protein HUJ04_000178 [Dendroctonus ponderosae]
MSPNSWPPLATGFIRDQNQTGGAAHAPPLFLNHATAASPGGFFSNFKSGRLLPPPPSAAPVDRHVWYPVQFQANSSFYFAAPDEMVLYSTANSSENGTYGAAHASPNDFDATVALVTMVITAILLGLIILATVIGNVFVIAAILLERNLQNVANYLILSLAVADLLVACLVMPLGAVQEVSQEWALGPELCDMWTSSDVLCCTASILHLVAIALDR